MLTAAEMRRREEDHREVTEQRKRMYVKLPLSGNRTISITVNSSTEVRFGIYSIDRTTDAHALSNEDMLRVVEIRQSVEKWQKGEIEWPFELNKE